MTNYTRLSLSEIQTAIADVARDARSTFGDLDERQLNWQPDATRWSIAQCFDHLVRGNELLLAAAETALNGPPRTGWQRVPVLPRVYGWILIRSQSPQARGRYRAPVLARPATSQIPGDILERFVAQHDAAEKWTRGIDQRSAGRAVMVSPFISAVTYSVLDGLRLLVAHDRRHFEQARRVLHSPEFAVA
jgi:hypothetical protein